MDNKQTYLVLLRGVNVGGKAMIQMTDLKTCLEQAGLTSVHTYIQSGNVLCTSRLEDTVELAELVRTSILRTFRIDTGVAVIGAERWCRIIAEAPAWWGQDPAWKHNLLVLIEPYDMAEVMASIGELKPGIERLQPGDGVFYQSMSLEQFGRTTAGKLASRPIYQRLTVRNYNTATKLAGLMQAAA